MEYTILWADNSLDLAKQVNQLLSEGWKLAGGVAAIPETMECSFTMYQAMLKERE